MSLILSSSYVLVSDAPELRQTTFTLMCWFKLNTFGTSQTLISKPVNGPPWGNPFATYLIRINTSTQMQFLQGDPFLSSFQQAVIDLSSSLQTGSWYHIAWAADVNTVPWSLYLNGVQPIGDPLNRAPTTHFNAGQLVFGGDFSGVTGPDYMHGEISDIRFYNRKLSSVEVFELYSSRGKYSSIVNGLVGYWPLDDGRVGSSASGSLIQDHISNNNGTGSSTGTGFGLFNGESLLSYSNTNGM